MHTLPTPCSPQRILALLLLLYLPCWAWAESGVRVKVTDATTGRPLEAMIYIQALTSAQTQQQTQTQTDGEALVEKLPAGLYDIQVSVSGYQTVRIPSARLINNKVTPLNVSMVRAAKEFEEVVVIGAATGDGRMSSVGTTFIDREGLRSSAGSGSDVLRALDGLPGLFSSGEYSSFTVRGNGPRDNLILVDGIPFANVVHFSDSYGEQEELEGGGRYSVFAPNVVAGAEFQPGGWGPAYGGKSGSLLKLEVAEGNKDTPSYTARLDLAGIEVGYDGPSGIDEQTSVLFSARNLNFGRVFETVGLEEIGTPKLTDVILKTVTQINRQNQLQVLAIYAPEEYTRDIDNVLASDEDNPGVYEDVELVSAEKDNTLLATTWTRLIGNDIELTNRLYYRTASEEALNGEAYPDLVPQGTAATDIPVRERILFSKAEETELGWHLEYGHTNTLGRFSAGLEVRSLDLSFDLNLFDDWILYSFDPSDFRPNPEQKYVELTPELVNASYQQKETLAAAYVNQQFEGERWNLRTGVRIEQDAFADQTHVSPRLGATWFLNQNAQITLTAGRYFQAPRNSDRALDAQNNILENESIDQLSLGFGYQINNSWKAFFETYYQKLDNLVTTLDGADQTLTNTGEGSSYGFDTALTKSFGNGWSGDIKYSYNESTVKDRAGGLEYDADFHRPHSASIGGVWEISERWKLSSRWKVASGLPTDETIIHENVLGDGNPLRYSQEIVSNNTERFDSYSSVNFRADYRRAFGALQLIAFIDIINVLGAENPSTTEFNEFVGQDLAEDGEMLPLFGFRLEW